MSSIWRSAHVRRWWLHQTEHNTNFGEILLHIFHKKSLFVYKDLLDQIHYKQINFLRFLGTWVMFDFWDRCVPDSIPWFRINTKLAMKVVHSPKWHIYFTAIAFLFRILRTIWTNPIRIQFLSTFLNRKVKKTEYKQQPLHSVYIESQLSLWIFQI